MHYRSSGPVRMKSGGIWAVLWALLALWGGTGAVHAQPETEADSLGRSPSLSIDAARATSAGAHTPRRAGDTLRVHGRVTVGTGGLPDTTLAFVQDGTAGIAVELPDGPDVRRGDSLWVEGVVQHKYGLTRLRGLRYEQVDALIRTPTPVPLTVSAAAGEGYEGRLVRVRGRVVANRTNEGGRYLLLTDPIPHATARIAVFVPLRRLADLSLRDFEPGDEVSITGVLSQHDRTAPYTTGYQVLPRDPDDLETPSDGMGRYQTIILVIVGGALLAVVVVLTLRSAVRRRTQQLVESRARFRRLAEATTEGVILHRDGAILDVNRALTDMMGYSREELMGRSVQQVLSAATQAPDGDERSASPTEVILVRKDGTRVPAEIDERVVSTAEQRVHVAALRDITERKRREAELVEAKEEAEEMARLKSSLLNNMSHEFRTPITSILGYADIILEEPDVDHESFARHIRRSGQRLSRTLQAVLEMAQMEAGTVPVEPTDTGVGAVVRAEVEEYRALADEKDLTLTVTTAEGGRVQTDPHLLRRIVGHLVHNAIKFTPEGRVDVSVEEGSERAVLRVTDSGIGIAPEAQDQLFEPFKQASEGRTRTHEGMGLGLALTRRMVTLLGGAVEVDSAPDEGSTFVVRLPSLADGANGRAAEASSGAEAA